MLIYRREGLLGYMRGLTPSIMKNTLTAGSYFSCLYYIENLLKRTQMLSDSWVSFFASASSRTIQSLISNPLIVIKTRFEVVGFSEYSGVTDALRKILANEGIAGLFTGLKISLIRDVPFSGIFYPIYNFFKTYLMLVLMQGKNGNSDNRTMNLAIATSMASFCANIVCCCITHPLDLIRTRVYF